MARENKFSVGNYLAAQGGAIYQLLEETEEGWRCNILVIETAFVMKDITISEFPPIRWVTSSEVLNYIMGSLNNHMGFNDSKDTETYKRGNNGSIFRIIKITENGWLCNSVCPKTGMYEHDLLQCHGVDAGLSTSEARHESMEILRSILIEKFGLQK